MLEARNSGNWNPRLASALIAFKPRQVLLAEHNNRNKMKMKMKTKTKTKTKDSKAPLNPEQKTLLLHSVLRYIERSGFSKTLKRFLSEAQIENDNWKAALLDLEDLFFEYSDKCNADRNLDIYKEQGLQTDGTSKIDGNINTSASKETIKKKKKKRSDDSDNKAVEDKSEATDEKLTESAKSAEDISNDMISESKVKSKGTKKSKKSSDSPGQTEQIKSDALEKDAADAVCELQMDESSKKHKDQKKKKSVLVTESSVNTPEFEAEVKPKDKKKKNKQSNDSLVEDVLATNQGVNKDEPVSDSAFQNTPDNPLEEKKVKSKDKKGKKVGSVSEVEVLGQETPIKLDSVNEYFRSSDDTIKKDKKSSKRKQLASDENEYEPVKEEATEERKRRKTEALEEAKNEDQLTTGVPHKPSLTQLHTHGNEDLESNGQEKTSIDQLNEHANGNLENNGGDKSAWQKSARKQNNGSAEPKTVNAFQRVKIDEVEFADEKLQDNSYWAKDGAEVGYGAKAQEILGQVRGRDFRHEKTKKKRGSYRGGQIDLNSHSIKFNYSDED